MNASDVQRRATLTVARGDVDADAILATSVGFLVRPHTGGWIFEGEEQVRDCHVTSSTCFVQSQHSVVGRRLSKLRKFLEIIHEFCAIIQFNTSLHNQF